MDSNPSPPEPNSMIGRPLLEGCTPFAPAPRPVFGVSLQEAVSVARVHEGLDLSAVVFRCVEFLEARGAIEEEGIYRLSGSSTEFHDVHAIAGLLKQFLRELVSPILARDLHPQFLKVIGSNTVFQSF
ncbi:uncharacterized protein MELLADRAFT_91918 [Melampsora larici-populina 98AG31]|uniref:Rho-GAP domain-containing protein n=1 Tax=Melampsora larici-populina (strain 98AG31 / pathotype 3-4-7) TaxID=747676 RepID=F4S0V5_MELLP|nr:uncharacterized protein MELLADRAFT_91918 [Melampsora larici-populina 98AG31]EGG01745.1 hypothetical protein MELLADRAFT_91918 [Melampsora larici-populina 98AG31]